MRKAYVVIFSFCLLVAGASAVQAADTIPLGNANFAVKLDSLHFTDRDNDIMDSGADTATYLGLEGYGNIAPNLYLGGEIGHAHTTGSTINVDLGQIATEVTFVPVEVNLKYAVEAGRRFSIDFGGGLSANYAHYQAKTNITVLSFPMPITGFLPPGVVILDVPEWLFGAQLFADVNVTFGPVFIGLNGKAQLVAPGKGNNYSGTFSYDEYSNWRVGGQLGVRF